MTSIARFATCGSPKGWTIALAMAGAMLVGGCLQDDVTPVSWVTVSASARIDRHNRFGTFLSPRVSALVRLGGGWTGSGL